jgi:hypothetical protein
MALATHLPDVSDKQALIDMTERLAHNCPDMRQQAADIADRLLFRHTGQHGNPDKVWYHRWTSANSSPRTFTGWEHWGKPTQSLTLAQLMVTRFSSWDQDNADTLQQMSGFYSEGPDAAVYNEKNEVRLLPGDILNDLWGVDFATEYQQELDEFWAYHRLDFRTMAKANYIAKALQEREAGRIGDAQFTILISAVAGNITMPIALNDLSATVTPQANLKVYAFDICGHTASDILRVVDEQGRHYVYVPGEVEAFHVFETDQDLYWWVLSQTNAASNRARFLSHFPLADNSDGKGGHLNDTLDQLFYGWGTTHRQTLVRNTHALEQDPFTYLTDSTRKRMYADMRLNMHSNAELRKQMWVGYLSTFGKVFGGLAAADWPVALALVGAGLADMGLNIDRAIHGHTTAERRAGVIAAILASIDVLFNAAFLWPAGEAADVAPKLPKVHVSVADMEHLLPAPLTPNSVEQALSGLETNDILDGMSAQASDKLRGVFVNGDGDTLIQIDDLPYRVRWMQDFECWAVVDPANPFSFYGSVPVRLDESGHWAPLPGPGVKGGGKIFGKLPWGSAMTDTPVALTPTFRYDIPARLRETLRNAANGFEDKVISGEREHILQPGQADPYAEFRRLRGKLQTDAGDYLANHPQPTRPTLPTLDVNASEPAIIQGILRNADGMVIGESHSSIASKKFLIDNMALLAKQHVRTLFMEHLLTDYHQVDLEAYARTGTMSKALGRYLDSLDVGFHTDQQGRYTFRELVRKATEHHVRVQAIDCAVSYRQSGVPDPKGTARQEMMNYFAHTVIASDQSTRGAGKWVALMGNTHANTFKGVPGVAELEGAIGIRMDDVPSNGIHGIRIDNGESLPDGGLSQGSGFVKSDFHYAMGTLRPSRNLEQLLQRPGMFTVETRADGQRLVHRSGDKTLVYTPVRQEGSYLYVERASWPSVHKRRFPNLRELITALSLMGMKHVD